MPSIFGISEFGTSFFGVEPSGPAPSPELKVPFIQGFFPRGSTNFGQDTYDLTDLPEVDIQVTGNLLVALRLARRLQTPYGFGILYGDDPDMGFDIASLLNSRFGKNDIMIAQVQIEQECLKDEQVQGVTATINASEPGIYRILINVVTADGPFLLTIPISGVTYKILFSNSGG